LGRPRPRWLEDVENDLREFKVKKLRQRTINREWAYNVNVAKVLRGSYSHGVSK
jgi:hypothetical protein